ncbi:hypothetical protein E1I69_01005 [Bacillus timonensis]|uniref:Uncharacterized protein n=1 Tax=Bacillus timonensis TaxID=1033734 RepID=A0A4V3V8M4_9BACI|nr:hypothetical protein [Bacillus timonensis]THE15463.1 hypothetical protein E1I69_01005 [Bacillus timonensis]
MEYAFIILLGIAILLLVISFYGKDRIKMMQEEIDQLSLSVVQETYLLKKKMKILEEELLTNDIDYEMGPPQASAMSLSNASILSLYDKGLSYEEIGHKTNLPVEEVRLILEQAKKMGLL